MTTVAWDGKTIASDTLKTDSWGLKSECREKILHGTDFICGVAGNLGQIMRWWHTAKNKSAAELLGEGFTPYEEGKDCPSIMLICKDGAFYISDGFFIDIGRDYHAIGSGRDYAITAMHLGKTASEAVAVAALFDNGTGGEVIEHDATIQNPI